MTDYEVEHQTTVADVFLPEIVRGDLTIRPDYTEWIVRVARTDVRPAHGQEFVMLEVAEPYAGQTPWRTLKLLPGEAREVAAALTRAADAAVYDR